MRDARLLMVWPNSRQTQLILAFQHMLAVIRLAHRRQRALESLIDPSAVVSVESIADRILVIRGQRVMLDVDIASLYDVPTKRVNEQVRRNRARFPSDFVFRLTSDEWAALMWSQIATTSRRRRLDNPPQAFTEHGCLMLANLLRSKRAVEVSVLVVRAFVRLRSVLGANRELAVRLDNLSKELGAHGKKLQVHERTILKLLEDIRRLTHFPAPRPRPIGFTAKLDDEEK